MARAADPPLSPHEERVYAEAAAEGLEITVRPDSWGLPMVRGHQVSLAEWRAFQAYVMLRGSDADRVKIAAQASGAAVVTVRLWRRRDWWQELFRLHVADEQELLHADLMSLRKDGVEGLRRVFRAEELPKGLPSAIVAGVAILTKIGVKPLQDSRNLTTINQNTIDNRGGVLVSHSTLDGLNQDDLLKVVTGEMRLPEE